MDLIIMLFGYCVMMAIGGLTHFFGRTRKIMMVVFMATVGTAFSIALASPINWFFFGCYWVAFVLVGLMGKKRAMKEFKKQTGIEDEPEGKIYERFIKDGNGNIRVVSYTLVK
mgnify:CR=1 FL=1